MSVLADVRGTFLSVVSHELRTPLTTIRGWGEVMVLEWDELDDASRREYAERILEASQRLQRLIDELLDESSL